MIYPGHPVSVAFYIVSWWPNGLYTACAAEAVQSNKYGTRFVPAAVLRKPKWASTDTVVYTLELLRSARDGMSMEEFWKRADDFWLERAGFLPVERMRAHEDFKKLKDVLFAIGPWNCGQPPGFEKRPEAA